MVELLQVVGAVVESLQVLRRAGFELGQKPVQRRAVLQSQNPALVLRNSVLVEMRLSLVMELCEAKVVVELVVVVETEVVAVRVVVKTERIAEFEWPQELWVPNES